MIDRIRVCVYYYNIRDDIFKKKKKTSLEIPTEQIGSITIIL